MYRWEVALLGSPLLHRHRGVRQPGFAHYVYLALSTTPLEYSLGAVEAATCIIRAQAGNAKTRRVLGTDTDETIPVPDDFALDVVATQLAALFHDISHATSRTPAS